MNFKNPFLFCSTLVQFLIAHLKVLFLIIVSFFIAAIFLFWFRFHFEEVLRLIIHHILKFTTSYFHPFIYSNIIKQSDQIKFFIILAQIIIDCFILKYFVKNLIICLINLFYWAYLIYHFIFTILNHLFN